MRASIIRAFLLFFLLAILGRLYFWQVVKADELSAKAEDQRFENIKLNALRGDIHFSDGSVLASTQPTYLLFGEPKILTDEEKLSVSQVLSKTFLEDQNLSSEDFKTQDEKLKGEIREKLMQNLFWVPIKRNLNHEAKEKIEKLKLKGIGFEQDFTRFYPESSSSAHLLGFVAANNKGEGTGYFGLEGFYNGDLKGIAGEVTQEKDALGVPILIGQTKTAKSKDGKSLTLNIDRVIQFIVEKNLKAGIQKYGAKSGSAIVMDPKTGAVLALAAYPNYDPGQFAEFPKENFRNPTVADSYEPGSTFKVLVMAAGINEGLVTPDTICDICSGPVEVNDYTIKTWNNEYRPNSTLKDVIVHSDNTGMVFVSRKLGLDKMYDYLKNFGFGEKTGIDLQDEASPDLREKKEWREIDLATSSFGQGIAVSGIQMIRAVAAIANGGYLVEPHIVHEIKDDYHSFEIQPKILKRVISEEAAKMVTGMMVAAVDEGEAKFAKPKGFKIAGKTGTAQIPVAGHYDPNKTIASFVGFAPADNPKYIMLVRYDQPSSSIYGAETAAPTFFNISRELFPYLKIAPSE